jgi:hypothetical protein
MGRSVTFKKVLVALLAIVGGTFGLAWTLGHLMGFDAPFSAKASPVRALPRPQPPTAPVVAAPTAPQAPTGEPVLFKVRAVLTTADGPEVAIEAVPATEPCIEPRWLDTRDIRMSKPASPLNLKSENAWCLRVMPGQRFTTQTLEGRWVTLADRTMSLDAAHQYMRIQHASGRWLGLRVIAAGYCASESSACSGTTLVEVSVDDHNLIIPMSMSSRSREVLRLTRDDELAHVTTRSSTTQPAEELQDEEAVEAEVEDVAAPAEDPAAPAQPQQEQ